MVFYLVSWNSIDNITGYEVDTIQSTVDGYYRTVTETTDLFDQVGTSMDMTVITRVRAFRDKEDGTRTYGKWSKTKTVKIYDGYGDFDNNAWEDVPIDDISKF